jgi:nucleoside-diphosphate-sugar epimerase
MSGSTTGHVASDISGGRGRRGPMLVTGAAGVMGIRLVRRLRQDGWSVRALTLPGDAGRAELERLGCELCEGDIRDSQAMVKAVAGVDTVFHLAAVILARDPEVLDAINRQGTANVVAAAGDAGVRHLVYVSSASVTYPRLTPYGRSKLAAERLVRGETRLAHTIVRPTLVYDGSGGQEFMMFVQYLERFPVVPFMGPGTARKQPVFSEDIVDGLARIAGKEVAFGKTYNLSGAEVITLEQFARQVLKWRGTPRPFVHLPLPLCRMAAALLGAISEHPPLTPYQVAGFTHDADLDCSLAMTELGYRPVGIEEGLARSFARQSSETTMARAPLPSVGAHPQE